MAEVSASHPSHFRFRVAVASCVTLVVLVASVVTWSDTGSVDVLIALPFDPNQLTAKLSSSTSNADVGSLAKVRIPITMILHFKV
jgi:hypothetical protein